MILHPGQPNKAYTALQLEEIGCGVVTTIRRRYAKVSTEQLTTIIVKNNKTVCYPFDLLTEKDQLKVSMYEAVNESETAKAIVKEFDEAYNKALELSPVPAVNQSSLPAIATPKQLAVPHATELSGKQDRIATARYSLMKMIEKRPSHKKVTPFIRELAQKINNGTDEKLVALAQSANDRKGTTREGISFDTLMHWWTKHQACGKQPNAMAPKIKGDMVPRTTLIDWLDSYQPGTTAMTLLPTAIPAWLPWFLDAYRRPQKPSMHHALKRISAAMPPQIERPSYDKVRRIMKKIPDIYAEKGRMTGAEYNSILSYVERDASGFMPMSICQVDGHSFKAYVAHPTTGAHFHPEVCGVICHTTKVLVGYSAGLSESHLTVAGAIKHSCLITKEKRYGGIPAILEPDLGAGNKAKLNSDEFTGLFARLGIDVRFPERSGNPQGHGAIERSNQSIWIDAAKDLPTYTGKDMDRGSRRKVYDQLERDLKRAKDEGKLGMVPKTSKLLLSWAEFLEFLEHVVTRYNNTPHKSLPKIKAPQPYNPDGPAVSRHMTPLEYWDSFVEQGFKPHEISIEDELFLEKICQPHQTVTVKRSRFTLLGNTYHSIDLEEYHNEQVIASWDIHNPHRVTVLDLKEQYICDAKWNGNRVHARPVSQVEQASMDRHNRRARLKERQLDMINAEADRKTIEARPLHIELAPEVLEYEAREELKNTITIQTQKVFADEHEIYEDIMQRKKNEEFVSAYELQWASDKDASFGVRGGGVGLFKADRYCHGRFDPKNQQQTEKAACA